MVSNSTLLEAAEATGHLMIVSVDVPAPKPALPAVEVGSILSASWGYDQTNVDFYEVVKVTKTGVRLRKIRKTRREVGSGSDAVTPLPGEYVSDEPAFFRRLHVGYHSGGALSYAGVSINSYSWASLWDGEPERETSMGWGH